METIRTRIPVNVGLHTHLKIEMKSLEGMEKHLIPWKKSKRWKLMHT